MRDYDRDGKLDLYAIKRTGASGKLEVHVLDGNSEFQSFSRQVATGLHALPANTTWDVDVQSAN